MLTLVKTNENGLCWQHFPDNDIVAVEKCVDSASENVFMSAACKLLFIDNYGDYIEK